MTILRYKRILTMGLLLFQIGKSTFAESAASVSFTETKATVTLHLSEDVATLTEVIDCLTGLPLDTSGRELGRSVATFYSKPLAIVSEGKRSPVFGAEAPSITSPEARAGAVRFEAEGSIHARSPNEAPDGFYAMDLVFDGPVPERFQFTVSYRTKLPIRLPVELAYTLFRQNARVTYPGRPRVDWGPYELKIDCGESYTVTLTKGVGWAEDFLGKASIDLLDGNEVRFRITRH